MLIDYTEMSYKTASAVAKLMEVYAKNFAGETYYIGQNPTSGRVYLGLENVPVCPFVDKFGDVMFEVFDFETGNVEEFESLEEAQDYADELQRIQMEEMED